MFYADLWADQPAGNCAKGAPGELDDLMFESRSPIPGSNNKLEALEAERNYLEAKRMCVGCPIREACLEQGMRPENLNQYAGVWGGLTAGERILLVKPSSLNNAAQWARWMRDKQAKIDAEKRRAQRERRNEERRRQRAERKPRTHCKRGHDLSVHGRKTFDRSRGWEYVRCAECKRSTDRVLTRPQAAQPCHVDGCGRFTYAAGLCQPHYRQQLRKRKEQAA